MDLNIHVSYNMIPLILLYLLTSYILCKEVMSLCFATLPLPYLIFYFYLYCDTFHQIKIQWCVFLPNVVYSHAVLISHINNMFQSRLTRLIGHYDVVLFIVDKKRLWLIFLLWSGKNTDSKIQSINAFMSYLILELIQNINTSLLLLDEVNAVT